MCMCVCVCARACARVARACISVCVCLCAWVLMCTCVCVLQVCVCVSNTIQHRGLLYTKAKAPQGTLTFTRYTQRTYRFHESFICFAAATAVPDKS